MKKMLFISTELPYPLQSGGKLKTYKLLEHFNRHYDLQFLSPLKGDDAMHREQFRSDLCLADSIHRRVDIPRTPLNLARSYAAGRPLNVQRTHDRWLAARARELCRHCDLVFLDHYEAGTYLPSDFSGQVVYHAHNAYHQLWERYADIATGPWMRVAARLEASRVKQAELKLARRADRVFASPNDAEVLSNLGVDESRIGETFHLGNDHQLDLPNLEFDQSANRIMYVGLLSWEANVVGLLWFLDAVWPLLRKMNPALEFDVVGKNPDPRLRDTCARLAGVHLHGFVGDLEAIYSKARVSIAPLTFGSGMKVKVLDAMSRGIPTVTTSIGAEGIDAVNGIHLSVADAASDMALAVDRLLREQDRWELHRDASRELIRERYTWSKVLASMQRELDQLDGWAPSPHRVLDDLLVQRLGSIEA